MHSYHQFPIEIPTTSIDNVALFLTDLGMGFQIIHLHMGRFYYKATDKLCFHSLHRLHLLDETSQVDWGCHRLPPLSEVKHNGYMAELIFMAYLQTEGHLETSHAKRLLILSMSDIDRMRSTMKLDLRNKLILKCKLTYESKAGGKD